MRLLRRAVIGGVGVLALMQLVPYGWHHPNPTVTSDAPWPNPETESIARAACYDCHSNETNWPIYSWAAPGSWLVRKDVERGRDELNFSEWDRDENEADDAAEMIEDGDMPPSRYRLMHPGARLSDDEKAKLIAALEEMEEENSGRG